MWYKRKAFENNGSQVDSVMYGTQKFGLYENRELTIFVFACKKNAGTEIETLIFNSINLTYEKYTNFSICR